MHFKAKILSVTWFNLPSSEVKRHFFISRKRPEVDSTYLSLMNMLRRALRRQVLVLSVVSPSLIFLGHEPGVDTQFDSLLCQLPAL